MIKINLENFGGEFPEDEENIRNKIELAENLDELLGVIDTIKGLQGHNQWFSREELKESINSLKRLAKNWPKKSSEVEKFINALNVVENKITRTAGLREKVYTLALEEFKNSIKPEENE